MKDRNYYKELKRKNDFCIIANFASFLLGESEIVEKQPAIGIINTFAGIAMTGYSFQNAFRMLDQFDEEDDTIEASNTIAEEFLIAPIVSSLMLGYSLSSKESKRNIRRKIGLRF